MIEVCIDAGHGGKDPGAVCGARLEKDDALRLALAVKGVLERQAVSVVMTRSSDVGVPILDRCARANKEGCAYFLSLHRDAAGAGANGISAWVHSRANDATFASAQKLVSALMSVTPANNRGVHRGTPQGYTDFGVNSQTGMASALLEVGFVTDKGDNRRFDENFEEYARAIAKAVCDIVGCQYTDADADTDAPQGDLGTDTDAPHDPGTDADAGTDSPQGDLDTDAPHDPGTDADADTDSPQGDLGTDTPHDPGTDADAGMDSPQGDLDTEDWRERALVAIADAQKWQAQTVEVMGECERLRGSMDEIRRILG